MFEELIQCSYYFVKFFEMDQGFFIKIEIVNNHDLLY